MMSDSAFVVAAYAVTAVTIAALVGWIFMDQHARKRELAELEAMGIRRRSATRRSPAGERP